MGSGANTPFWQLLLVGVAGFSGAAFGGYKLLWRKDVAAKVDLHQQVIPEARTPAPAPATAATPPAPAKPMEYPLPAHVTGTRLDYKIHIESARRGSQLTNESWVVAEVTGDRMKWVVNGDHTGESSTNPFVPMLETGKMVGREDISRTVTGDSMTIFPLAPGKSFRLAISGQNGMQQSGNYDYRCFVTSFLKAKSKLGDLEVVEVKCTAAGPGINYTARYLYAPSLGASIYYERKPAKVGGYSMVRELVAIQRPAQ